jgi:hypothetical protein
MNTMSNDDKPKTLTKLKPGDGYVVKLIDDGNSIGVYFNLRLDDRYVPLLDMTEEQHGTITLGFWTAPNEFQRGEAQRLYLLSDAIARFFNTSGDWSELGVLFSQLQKNGVGTAEHEPYHLIRSYLTIAAIEDFSEDVTATYSYEHIYAPELPRLTNTTPIVVVNESTGVSTGTYGELIDDGEQ